MDKMDRLKLRPKVLGAISCDEFRHAERIAQLAGVAERDWRTAYDTRQIIAELIKEGFLIISSSAGYKAPSNRAELDTYLDSLRGRIAGIQARIDSLENAWRAREDAENAGDGQLELFG